MTTYEQRKEFLRSDMNEALAKFRGFSDAKTRDEPLQNFGPYQPYYDIGFAEGKRLLLDEERPQ